MLKFYNTKTRKVDEFKSIKPEIVSLYTCGPTVYNYLHVGNWVSYIRWDTLVRVLQASGYKVERVMNITDVGHLVSDADEGEDKMQKGATREGKTAWEIAKVYTDDFIDGMNTLNLLEPTYITKATAYIDQQIALIKKLESKDFTYNIDDGVYFDTSKFATYADFAHLDLEDQRAGARVEFNPQKKNSSDFALWKFTEAGEKRDMEWESPWGKGFPGWHLECSAMAMDKLGETIDIHTGGIDHIPVHHTNEIAQSEAATGKTFANYWLHNNFLLVDGTKISKSLGNTYTLHDLAKKGFSAQDFKVFVLQSHYRTESNFSWENLQAAANRLNSFKAMAQMRFQVFVGPVEIDFAKAAENILVALHDDLNTPIALSILSEVASGVEANGISVGKSADFEMFLATVDSLLGLSLNKEQDISKTQKDLIAKRQTARESKDWQTSDKIRKELEEQGISVRDTDKNQIWSRTV